MNNKELYNYFEEARKASPIFSGEELDSIVNSGFTQPVPKHLKKFNKQKGAVKMSIITSAFIAAAIGVVTLMNIASNQPLENVAPASSDNNYTVVLEEPRQPHLPNEQTSEPQKKFSGTVVLSNDDEEQSQQSQIKVFTIKVNPEVPQRNQRKQPDEKVDVKGVNAIDISAEELEALGIEIENNCSVKFPAVKGNDRAIVVNMSNGNIEMNNETLDSKLKSAPVPRFVTDETGTKKIGLFSDKDDFSLIRTCIFSSNNDGNDDISISVSSNVNTIDNTNINLTNVNPKIKLGVNQVKNANDNCKKYNKAKMDSILNSKMKKYPNAFRVDTLNSEFFKKNNHNKTFIFNDKDNYKTIIDSTLRFSHNVIINDNNSTINSTIIINNGDTTIIATSQDVSPIHNCTPRIEISNGNIRVYSDDSSDYNGLNQFYFDSNNSGVLDKYWNPDIEKYFSDSLFDFENYFDSLKVSFDFENYFDSLKYSPYFQNFEEYFKQFEINEDSLFEIDGSFYQPDSASVVRFSVIKSKVSSLNNTILNNNLDNLNDHIIDVETDLVDALPHFACIKIDDFHNDLALLEQHLNCEELIEPDSYFLVNKLIPLRISVPCPNDKACRTYIFWYEPSEDVLLSLPPEIRRRIMPEVNALLRNNSLDCSEIPVEPDESYMDVWRSCSGAVENLAVYPNPASNNVNIEYNLTKPRTVTISIHDLSGRMIADLSQNVQHNAGYVKENLKIESIPAGIYLVVVKTQEGEQAVQRLIIE